MTTLRELGRRGMVGTLSILVDMLAPRWPDRWSDVGTSLAGLSLGQIAQSVPGSLGFWAEAAILSTALGMSRTRVDAAELARCLDLGDQPGARRAGTRLTGRDVSALADADLAGQSIEAIECAAADNVIAPLFYYVLAGLPGAMVYQLLASGSIAVGEAGRGLLRRVRLLPRRIAGGLGVVSRRLTWRYSAETADAQVDAPAANASAVRAALGTMRTSVALAGGALLLLAALTRMHARSRQHVSTKG